MTQGKPPPPTAGKGPTLHHTLLASQPSATTPASILAIATDPHHNYIFCSSSHSDGINVFDAHTYLAHPLSPLRGHNSSILAFELARDRQWLFSASADGTVRVWDSHTLQCLYVILVHGDDPDDQDCTVGDVFALRWDPSTQTLFMGCQNTSIRWCNLSRLRSGGGGERDRARRSSLAQKSRAMSRETGAGLRNSSVGSTSRHRQQHSSPSPSRSPSPTSEDIDSSGILSATALPIPRPHKFFDSDYFRQQSGSYSSQVGSPGNQSLSSRPSSPSATTPDARSTPFSHHPLSRHASQQHAYTPNTGGFSSPNLPSVATPGAAGADALRYVRVSSTCVIPNAHYGYVYALALLSPARKAKHRQTRQSFPVERDARGTLLASGSGDEDVKLWSFEAAANAGRGQLRLVTTLSSAESRDGGAVLSLASWNDTTLFVGKQGGRVEIWDLETGALLRMLNDHGSDDVLALVAIGGGGTTASLLSAGADGFLCRYDASFHLADKWRAHGDQGSVLSCAMLPPSSSGSSSGPDDAHREDAHGLETDEADTDREETADFASTPRVLTGGSDGSLKVWGMPFLRASEVASSFDGLSDGGTIRRAGFALESAAPADGNAVTSRRQAHKLVLSFDTLLTALSAFVAFRSVSSDPSCREESRQSAYWLKSHLASLGASDSQILPGAYGRNPLVLSVFEARGPQGRVRPRKRILFYGHYDVIDAVDGRGSWKSSPWTLTGRDGYLYGRGVSDNKGPILAVAAAVQRLYSRRQLDVDVVFLIEGEEESGSAGFKECLERNRDKIGRIDLILLSNSYWLDEQTPCLTMGMRGVVQCTVTICKPNSRSLQASHDAATGPPAHSQRERGTARCDPHGTIEGSLPSSGSNGEHDVHSGVQGGSLREPMIDMVQLLSYLSDGKRVLIPGFYDDVCPLGVEERQSYTDIVELLKANSLSAEASSPHAIPTADSLMARWRYPSLSVHSISVSGSGNSTIIPAVVSSKISIRLVPNQSLHQIRDALDSFLRAKFIKELNSGNELEVSVGHEASWWVGDDASEYTNALRRSIRDAWAGGPQAPHNHPDTPNEKERLVPISIREGGSIPAVSILESTLTAWAREDGDDGQDDSTPRSKPSPRVGAVHLPMGQSSDSAHLSDERIRLLNLVKGREIVEAFLVRLGAMN
ncbi:unnamed protein product [Parajaminaea phylloscopi]